MPEHYSQFGEAAGAAMAHNARTAARHAAERATEEQPTEAPRDGLSEPLSAPHSPHDTQDPDGRDNASDGRTADPGRAELCRQFKDAITRRWDVAPFVIDEIVDDAVDCHLELVGRANALLDVVALELEHWDGEKSLNLLCRELDIYRGEAAPQAGDDTTGGAATLTVTVTAPTQENAGQWATTLRDLINAEHGDEMRLHMTISPTDTTEETP